MCSFSQSIPGGVLDVTMALGASRGTSGLEPSSPAGSRLCASKLSVVVVALSSVTIVTALSLVKFNPRRFQIHPLPYLSDAGLFDPERVVISLGLTSSAAFFVPLALALFAHQRRALVVARGKAALRIPGWYPVPAARIARMGLLAGFVLAGALATFVSVPGWFLPHHVFAAVFAIAAALWCLSVAAFDAAVAADRPVGKDTRVIAALGALQMMIVGVFAVVWVSVITGRPWKMIPNKDFRFVILAVLEYVGTSGFLVVIRMVGLRLSDQYITLSLAPKGRQRHLSRSVPPKESSMEGIV